MEVYKVFDVDRSPGKEMFSVSGIPGYDLIYKMGEKTVAPEGTKLFIFKDLALAKFFAAGSEHLAIWEVECGDEIKQALHCAKLASIYIDWFWAWMAGKAQEIDYQPEHYTNITMASPNGTYVCDWVIPKRRVWG